MIGAAPTDGVKHIDHVVPAISRKESNGKRRDSEPRPKRRAPGEPESEPESPDDDEATTPHIDIRV